jgi:hypothetical protein
MEHPLIEIFNKISNMIILFFIFLLSIIVSDTIKYVIDHGYNFEAHISEAQVRLFRN